jgi:hypothetical protein
VDQFPLPPYERRSWNAEVNMFPTTSPLASFQPCSANSAHLQCNTTPCPAVRLENEGNWENMIATTCSSSHQAPEILSKQRH